MKASLSARRAWIEICIARHLSLSDMSLSARRAWIEILTDDVLTGGKMSLSARRAWIEILPALKLIACHNVALRKESVDRNKSQKRTGKIVKCRSPQGERG